MEDSVLEGFGGGAAPRAKGWRVLVEPGGVGSEVALPGPYLMDAAGKKFGEAHERIGGEGGTEGVPQRGGSEEGPLLEEDGSGLLLEGDEGVGGRVWLGQGEGRHEVELRRGRAFLPSSRGRMQCVI